MGLSAALGRAWLPECLLAEAQGLELRLASSGHFELLVPVRPLRLGVEPVQGLRPRSWAAALARWGTARAAARALAFALPQAQGQKMERPLAQPVAQPLAQLLAQPMEQLGRLAQLAQPLAQVLVELLVRAPPDWATPAEVATPARRAMGQVAMRCEAQQLLLAAEAHSMAVPARLAKVSVLLARLAGLRLAAARQAPTDLQEEAEQSSQPRPWLDRLQGLWKAPGGKDRCPPQRGTSPLCS